MKDKLHDLISILTHPNFTLSKKKFSALGTDYFGDVISIGNARYYVYGCTIYSLRWSDWFKVLGYQFFGIPTVLHFPMM